MHLKRNSAPKFWPIVRKGSKYLTVASHNQRDSIPLVIVIRDILKMAKNKKEVKRALLEKQIQINHKSITEVEYPVSLFDVISLPSSKKNYKAVLSDKKKMIFLEISDKESETKIYKVKNKKMLPNKILQLNLMHGLNIRTKEKVNTGDSIVYNHKENKVVKTIAMEKGKEVFIVEGKHAGNIGKIEDIVFRGGKHIAKINSKEGKINVWIKNLIAIG